MHDVIQVWHTVHAAMHCVSLLVKQEKAGRALTCGTATSTCLCLQTCVCVRTAGVRFAPRVTADNRSRET